MTLRAAAALSEHPLGSHAIGEVAGQLLETVGQNTDLALLFVTAAHAGALEDIAGAVREVLHPRVLLGCTAESVVGGAREVEARPAVSLWAGDVRAGRPFALTAGDTLDVPDDAGALLLLADPFSFPVDELFARLAEIRPGLPVVGGMASAAHGPGGNRLVVDDAVVTEGAVGAFLGPGVEIATVVSQGCRPIGRPFVVTRSEQNVVYELGGQPALERLQELVAVSSGEERELMARGLHLGLVVDEHKAEFERGDFVVRNVIGADRQSGAIAIGAICEVGATVQFHVRDAATADEDLRALVGGHDAEAALLFTCNGRGTRLFGAPDHDAAVVSDAFAGAPLAGFFCAGELGPVGGRNFLHGFTASVVLFRG